MLCTNEACLVRSENREKRSRSIQILINTAYSGLCQWWFRRLWFGGNYAYLCPEYWLVLQYLSVLTGHKMSDTIYAQLVLRYCYIASQALEGGPGRMTVLDSAVLHNRKFRGIGHSLCITYAVEKAPLNENRNNHTTTGEIWLIWNIALQYVSKCACVCMYDLTLDT
jgi:hypothetical protein